LYIQNASATIASARIGPITAAAIQALFFLPDGDDGVDVGDAIVDITGTVVPGPVEVVGGKTGLLKVGEGREVETGRVLVEVVVGGGVLTTVKTSGYLEAIVDQHPIM